MNDDNLHPWIDPELEARIIALVLGEASDFEKEELERLINEQPELGTFRDRMQSVHDLLRQNFSEEINPTADEWKLSPERRSNVLEQIDGKEKANSNANQSEDSVSSDKVTERHRWFHAPKVRFGATAAAVAAVAIVLLIPAQQSMVDFAATNKATGEALELGIDEPSRVPAIVASPSSQSNLARVGEGIRAEYESSYVFKKRLSDIDSESKQKEASSLSLASAPRKLAEATPEPVAAPSSPAATRTLESRTAPSPFPEPADKRQREHLQRGEGLAKSDQLNTAAARAIPTTTATPARQDALDLVPMEVAEEALMEDEAILLGAKLRKAEQKAEQIYADAQAGKLITFSPGSAGTVPVDAFVADADLGIKAPIRLRVTENDGIIELEKNEPEIAAIQDLTPQVDYLLSPNARTQDRVIRRPVVGVGGTIGTDQLDSDMSQADTLTLSTLDVDSRGFLRPEDDAFRDESGRFEFSIGAKFGEVPEINAKPDPLVILDEIDASEENFSTFSLHVSDVSFKIAQAALEKGEWPNAATIRIEEFVNAFDYGDPAPTQEERVACQLEQAIHPFFQQRNLLRVAMRTAALGRAAQTPLRITLLLDNSGSMERSDRRETVSRAFNQLAPHLTPYDSITLISFARQPRLVAEEFPGNRTAELAELASQLPSEGGTNLEDALKLAFEKAQHQFLDTAQNRVVLFTDGAANLGDANPDTLSKLIETMRDQGIAFDAAGIGADGLNDEILEALTRKGDGRYYLLNQPEDADEGFARQIAGALRPAAKNVKVQIEFNPDRVGKYKLLGFEKHRLDKEDFRDDSVDAAEMAAEEAGVAVYQVEAKPDGEGDLGFASVRFRDMNSGEMVEKRWPILYESTPSRPGQSSGSMKIATVASQFAVFLKGDPAGQVVELDQLSALLSSLPERFAEKERVQQLARMIQQARTISGQ